MRIAVISDTHDRLPADIPPQLTSADEIWHLGDVCNPDTLDDLYALGIPIQIVLGNNDYSSWPLSITREIHGFNIYITHIPPTRTPPGTQIVLHGHTHYPRNEILAGGIRWLNPGAITLPRYGFPASYAWMEILPGKLFSWDTVLV